MSSTKAPRKARQESFATYIKKIGKHVSKGDMGFSAETVNTLNTITYDLLKKIASEAQRLCVSSKRETLNEREIEKAATTILPGDMGEKAPAVIASVHAKWDAAGKSVRSQSARAGLILPIGRLTRMLKKGSYASRIGKHAGLALGAVLEQTLTDFCEAALTVLKKDKKKRLMPRHIQMVLEQEPIFAQLFQQQE